MNYPSDMNLVIPIEIRPGVVVRIHAPADLTRSEAEWVADVIKAYVRPRSPELSEDAIRRQRDEEWR
jgi:hypothetical protein